LAAAERDTTKLLRNPCFAVSVNCSRSLLYGMTGKTQEGPWIKSCTILTTIPNSVAGVVHDRMPVILHPDSYDLWLDPGMNEVQVVSELLNPYDACLMRSYPVSTRINRVENDNEECSRPVEIAQHQKPPFS
jgi:putative SOS response-associated peptidase YedK